MPPQRGSMGRRAQLRDDLRKHVTGHLGSPEEGLIIDETGFCEVQGEVQGVVECIANGTGVGRGRDWLSRLILPGFSPFHFLDPLCFCPVQWDSRAIAS